MSNAALTYPSKLAKWQVDTLTKCTMSDFALGLTYYVAERIGEDQITTYPGDTYQDMFVLRPVTVTELTINNDLLVFQSRLREGTAIKTTNPATTTVPATTTAP